MSYSVSYDGNVFHAPSFRQLYAFVRDMNATMGMPKSRYDPKIIVDVGASIGSTLICWQTAFPEAEIIGIEPYPENLKYLKMNTNGITVIEKAASNFTGTLRMSCEHENTGLAMVSDEGVEVEADTLDNMIERCDILKIDVEGHDLEVIEGAERLLSTNPYVIIETDDITRYENMFKHIRPLKKSNYSMWNGR